MPIYHGVHNLYVVGLADSQWTQHLFWVVYQKFGLGTFVLVSGMAFVFSTQNGINWERVLKRTGKLAFVALGITMITYFLMPANFVRFGVIHFFATTILLASIVRPLNKWLILPGVCMILVAAFLPYSGLYPEPYLYITGLMSDRPRSMGYIPLLPWFGVFMLGMGVAHFLPLPEKQNQPRSWVRPIIFLGKHSLMFYLVHLIVVYALLTNIAYLVK